MDACRFFAMFVIGILVFVALPQSFAQENDPLVCQSDFILVMRPDNAGSACVTPTTAEKFILRGWSYSITEASNTGATQPVSPSSSIEILESVVLSKTPTMQSTSSKTILSPDDAIKDAQSLLAELITSTDKICQKDFMDRRVYPLSYSVTGGEFHGLCANLHHKWFDIYLNADAGGSITLEIPKNAVDLKQYDYLDCYRNQSYYFDDEKRSWGSYSVKQIAQSDYSRTLKITFDEPIEERISSFWPFLKIDNLDYSQPNSCINEYEKNNQDPIGHITENRPYDSTQPAPEKCMLDLYYTITGGQVDMICGRFSPTPEEDHPLRGSELKIYLSDVKSLEYLTVEIPWYVLPPNRLAEYYVYAQYDNIRFVDPNEYATYANKKIFDSKDCISTEITAVTPEYYRLEIPIKPNEKVIKYSIDQNSGIQLDISEVIDSIRTPTTPIDDPRPPFSYTDELDMLRIAPFDKNVDGKFVKYCKIIPNTYSDNFDNLDNWRFGDGNWHITQPYEDIPNENNQTNMVVSSSNCETECVIYLRQVLDASRELLISFDRFIADDVDHDEGLYIQYSNPNDVDYWITLASYTKNNNMNTERWTNTNLLLDVPLDTTSLRFLAQSDAIDEIIEIDNLSITPRTHGGGGEYN